MRWIDVGGEADQAPGTARSVIVSGAAVALFRTADGWVALEDRCPHAGAPLSAGLLREGAVVCAWHGWRFDAGSGACLSVPGGPAVRRFDVRVEGGRVLVGDGDAAHGDAPDF